MHRPHRQWLGGGFEGISVLFIGCLQRCRTYMTLISLGSALGAARSQVSRVEYQCRKTGVLTHDGGLRCDRGSWFACRREL